MDDATFCEASIENIHDKQLVFPYGQTGDASEGQLGVRIRAALSLAVRVSITAEFTNDFAGLRINHLDAVLLTSKIVKFLTKFSDQRERVTSSER